MTLLLLLPDVERLEGAGTLGTTRQLWFRRQLCPGRRHLRKRRRRGRRSNSPRCHLEACPGHARSPGTFYSCPRSRTPGYLLSTAGTGSCLARSALSSHCSSCNCRSLFIIHWSPLLSAASIFSFISSRSHTRRQPPPFFLTSRPDVSATPLRLG